MPSMKTTKSSLHSAALFIAPITSAQVITAPTFGPEEWSSIKSAYMRCQIGDGMSPECSTVGALTIDSDPLTASITATQSTTASSVATAASPMSGRRVFIGTNVYNCSGLDEIEDPYASGAPSGRASSWLVTLGVLSLPLIIAAQARVDTLLSSFLLAFFMPSSIALADAAPTSSSTPTGFTTPANESCGWIGVGPVHCRDVAIISSSAAAAAAESPPCSALQFGMLIGAASQLRTWRTGNVFASVAMMVLIAVGTLVTGTRASPVPSEIPSSFSGVVPGLVERCGAVCIAFAPDGANCLQWRERCQGQQKPGAETLQSAIWAISVGIVGIWLVVGLWVLFRLRHLRVWGVGW